MRAVAAKKLGVKEITSNRKAFHEYFVLERFEAGIELAGTEVKSIRAGNVNLKDAFCTIKNEKNTEFRQKNVEIPQSLCYTDKHIM